MADEKPDAWGEKTFGVLLMLVGFVLGLVAFHRFTNWAIDWVMSIE